jgi:hypothetical protein
MGDSFQCRAAPLYHATRRRPAHRELTCRSGRGPASSPRDGRTRATTGRTLRRCAPAAGWSDAQRSECGAARPLWTSRSPPRCNPRKLRERRRRFSRPVRRRDTFKGAALLGCHLLNRQQLAVEVVSHESVAGDVALDCHRRQRGVERLRVGVHLGLFLVGAQQRVERRLTTAATLQKSQESSWCARGGCDVASIVPSSMKCERRRRRGVNPTAASRAA